MALEGSAVDVSLSCFPGWFSRALTCPAWVFAWSELILPPGRLSDCLGRAGAGSGGWS